jgi:ribosome maturation protein Sdo1
MGLGDMLGNAAGALGGTDEIVSKISESGIDLSALTEMDADSVTAMLEEKGIDLSILESLGLSVEDVVEKVKEHLG